MDIIEYLERTEQNDDIELSMHSQVLGLKELLENKENFKEKDDWKRSSFITNREDDK